jgi:hypothetical protein
MGMAYGLIESLEARRHLSVGTPDPTFGDDGAVRIAVAPGSAVGAMDTLADGRFVVAHTTPDGADGTILRVSRYLPNGSTGRDVRRNEWPTRGHQAPRDAVPPQPV